MRFKTDENIPVGVADLVRAAGFDALTTGEQGLNGVADAGVAAVCRVEQRAVVTLDQDFCDIRRFPPETYSGIIVLRPQRQTIPRLLQLMARVVTVLATEPLVGNVWIVDEGQVRIRPGHAP